MFVKVQPVDLASRKTNLAQDNISVKDNSFSTSFFRGVRWMLFLGAVYTGSSLDLKRSWCPVKLKKTFIVICGLMYISEIFFSCYDLYLKVSLEEDVTRHIAYLIIFASSAYQSVVLSITMAKQMPQLERRFLQFEKLYGMSKNVSRLPTHIKLSIIWLCLIVGANLSNQVLYMKRSVRIYCDAFPLCNIPQQWHDVFFPFYMIMFVISTFQWVGLFFVSIFFTVFLAREFDEVNENFKSLTVLEQELEARFDQLVDKHNNLVEVLEGTSHCFQHYSFLGLFLMIPVNCSFLFASYGNINDTTEVFFLLSGMTLGFSVIGIRLFMEARVCTKAHGPLNYLRKIKRELFSNRGLQNLCMFTTRLTVESIGYSIYGLLTINMPTLLGIFGTLITYIIIVVQFGPTDSPCQCDCMKNVSYCIMH